MARDENRSDGGRVGGGEGGGGVVAGAEEEEQRTVSSSSSLSPIVSKKKKMRFVVEVFSVAFVATAVLGLLKMVESNSDLSWQLSDGLTRHNRQLDSALVKIVSHLNSTVYLSVVSSMCYKCPFQLKKIIEPDSNTSVTFDTRFTQHLNLSTNSSSQNLTRSFVYQGTYVLLINGSTSDSFVVTLQQTYFPPDSNIPVYILLAIIVFLFFMWHFLQFLIKRRVFCQFAFFLPVEQLINADLGMPLVSEDAVEVVSSTRIKSVDAFRGLSLAIMIFVNYGGGQYWYFQHSAWDGLTVADLVFPWFVFLMGTSIAMSFRGALRRGTSRLTLFWKVVKRTTILFFFGLVLSNHQSCGRNVSFSNLRILGVLQRLALTYFVVASLETVSATSTDVNLRLWWSFARDLFPFWLTWLVCGCLILLHTCLTFLLPVPGCPTGYLGPGGLADHAKHFNCTGGAARYIDHVILGDSHMYQYPTSMKIYENTVPYDPEGILGILMSIVICILGLQAGRILQTYQSWARLVRRWLFWAVFTGLVAGVLCRFEQFDGWIPVNKNLWSLSFILALSSMAFLLLSLLYVVIDVLQLWNGAPFLYPGMNSIVIYMCHEVFEDYFPLQISVPQTHLAHLAMDVWGMCFWLIISAALYYKDIFIAI